MATPGQRTRLRAVSAATVAILAAFLPRTFQPRDVLESILDYTSRERRPRLVPRRRLEEGGLVGYLAILYVRSPAVFFEDSILSPPLLPRMLTNPRTV